MPYSRETPCILALLGHYQGASHNYKEECLRIEYYKYQQIHVTYAYRNVPIMYKNLKLLEVKMASNLLRCLMPNILGPRWHSG
jgi:hypothetical protein